MTPRGRMRRGALGAASTRKSETSGSDYPAARRVSIPAHTVAVDREVMGNAKRFDWPRGASPAQTAPCSATILINNFNYRSFVGAAIDSAFAQTHPPKLSLWTMGRPTGPKR